MVMIRYGNCLVNDRSRLTVFGFNGHDVWKLGYVTTIVLHLYIVVIEFFIYLFFVIQRLKTCEKIIVFDVKLTVSEFCVWWDIESSGLFCDNLVIYSFSLYTIVCSMLVMWWDEKRRLFWSVCRLWGFWESLMVTVHIIHDRFGFIRTIPKQNVCHCRTSKYELTLVIQISLHCLSFLILTPFSVL